MSRLQTFAAAGFWTTLLLSMAGCASTPKPLPVAQSPSCLPLVSYTPDFQKQAAEQLQSIPPASPVAQMVVDYGKMRAADRACLGSR
jgi:hypothetical protein